MTPPSLYDRILDYIVDHRWAWLAARYTVVPVIAAVIFISQHLPAYIAEIRAEVAELDAQLKARTR